MVDTVQSYKNLCQRKTMTYIKMLYFYKNLSKKYLNVISIVRFSLLIQ